MNDLKNKFDPRLLLIGLGGLIVLSLTIMIIANSAAPATKTLPAAHYDCPTDEKMCADGTTVKRAGPTCAFVDCPTHGEAVEKEANVAMMEERVLLNGVYIMPMEVLTDNRCRIGVLCLQAGTVTILAQLTSGTESKQLHLTLTEPVLFAGKSINLTNVTPFPHAEEEITTREYRFKFAVDDAKGQQNITEGTLNGKITLGPICPVEDATHPCKPTAEMYAARKIAVYTAEAKTLLKIITPDASGNFSVPLTAGMYYVDLEGQMGGIGSVSGLPQTVTIVDGRTVHLDINIDTGIR